MTGEKADSFQIAEQLLAAADLDELIGCWCIGIPSGVSPWKCVVMFWDGFVPE